MAKKKESEAETPCEAGGNEILPLRISAAADKSVLFRLYMCKAAANLRLWVDDDLRVDQDVSDETEVLLSPLDVGKHRLRWAIFTSGGQWQSRSEIDVDGVTLFRHRKSDESDNPTNHFLVLIDVA